MGCGRRDRFPWTSMSPLPKKRVLSEREIRKLIREEYGIEIVKGFSEVNPKSACDICSVKDGYIASFGYVKEAFKVCQNNRDWIEWRTEEIPATNSETIVFIFGMSLGYGSPIPQPSGRFKLFLNDEEIIQFCVTKHSRLWFGRDGTRLYFHRLRYNTAPLGLGLNLDAQIKDESAVSFGLGLLAVPAWKLKDFYRRKATLKVVPIGETRGPSSYTPTKSKRWFRLDNVLWSDCNFYEALNVISKNRKEHAEVGEFQVFFGDIHSHSGIGKGGVGCGTGTLKENFEYARDVAGLDIYSLTDHDWQMEPEHWEDLQRTTKEYYEPGRFVTFPAFEWTSKTYGHRNVYYLEEGYPFMDSNSQEISETAPTPEDLWRELDRLGVEAITIPHHTCVPIFPVSLADYYNPRYDRLVEIYSIWGNSELCDEEMDHRGCFEGLTVREILNYGCKMGIIASSDSHDGHPGNSCGPPLSYLGSGWIAVLARRLERREIWNAMKMRRCYGTTGEPIILDFRLDGHFMGEEVSVDEVDGKPRLEINIDAPTRIEQIQIIKNGEVVVRMQCYGKKERKEWIDPEYRAGEASYYYVKVVQRDREMAWSSPIWIE